MPSHTLNSSFHSFQNFLFPQIYHDLPCHRVFAPCVYHLLASLIAHVCPLIFLFLKTSSLGDVSLTHQTRYYCWRQSSTSSMSFDFCIGRRFPGDNYCCVPIALYFPEQHSANVWIFNCLLSIYLLIYIRHIMRARSMLHTPRNS